MGQEMVRTVVSIVTAIIGLAVLAVLLSPKSQTVGVVGSLSHGLAEDISAATGPVTGQSMGLGFTLAPSSFTG